MNKMINQMLKNLHDSLKLLKDDNNINEQDFCIINFNSLVNVLKKFQDISKFEQVNLSKQNLEQSQTKYINIKNEIIEYNIVKEIIDNFEQNTYLPFVNYKSKTRIIFTQQNISIEFQNDKFSKLFIIEQFYKQLEIMKNTDLEILVASIKSKQFIKSDVLEYLKFKFSKINSEDILNTFTQMSSTKKQMTINLDSQDENVVKSEINENYSEKPKIKDQTKNLYIINQEQSLKNKQIDLDENQQKSNENQSLINERLRSEEIIKMCSNSTHIQDVLNDEPNVGFNKFNLKDSINNNNNYIQTKYTNDINQFNNNNNNINDENLKDEQIKKRKSNISNNALQIDLDIVKQNFLDDNFIPPFMEQEDKKSFQFDVQYNQFCNTRPHFAFYGKCDKQNKLYIIEFIYKKLLDKEIKYNNKSRVALTIQKIDEMALEFKTNHFSEDELNQYNSQQNEDYAMFNQQFNNFRKLNLRIKQIQFMCPRQYFICPQGREYICTKFLTPEFRLYVFDKLQRHQKVEYNISEHHLDNFLDKIKNHYSQEYKCYTQLLNGEITRGYGVKDNRSNKLYQDFLDQQFLKLVEQFKDENLKMINVRWNRDKKRYTQGYENFVSAVLQEKNDHILRFTVINEYQRVQGTELQISSQMINKQMKILKERQPEEYTDQLINMTTCNIDPIDPKTTNEYEKQSDTKNNKLQKSKKIESFRYRDIHSFDRKIHMPINNDSNPYHKLKKIMSNRDHVDEDIERACGDARVGKANMNQDAFSLTIHKFKKIRYQLKHTYQYRNKDTWVFKFTEDDHQIVEIIGPKNSIPYKFKVLDVIYRKHHKALKIDLDNLDVLIKKLKEALPGFWYQYSQIVNEDNKMTKDEEKSQLDEYLVQAEKPDIIPNNEESKKKKQRNLNYLNQIIKIEDDTDYNADGFVEVASQVKKKMGRPKKIKDKHQTSRFQKIKSNSAKNTQSINVDSDDQDHEEIVHKKDKRSQLKEEINDNQNKEHHYDKDELNKENNNVSNETKISDVQARRCKQIIERNKKALNEANKDDYQGKKIGDKEDDDSMSLTLSNDTETENNDSNYTQSQKDNNNILEFNNESQINKTVRKNNEPNNADKNISDMIMNDDNYEENVEDFENNNNFKELQTKVVNKKNKIDKSKEMDQRSINRNNKLVYKSNHSMMKKKSNNNKMDDESSYNDKENSESEGDSDYQLSQIKPKKKSAPFKLKNTSNIVE